MKKILAILLVWLFSCDLVVAKNTVPKDVRTFVKNADTCIHLSEEWDEELPEENKKKIKQDIDKYCGAAKKQFDGLSVKYKNNMAVQRILGQYDDSIASYSESD